MHGYRQMTKGLGGGDVAKVSVSRPNVCEYLRRLGGELQWHGALSLDYILLHESQIPLFIDANPRLVEPMNAAFSGVNLADVLVRISSGEPFAMVAPSGKQVRTHMLLMALLSSAAVKRRRRDVIAELMRAIRRRVLHAGSREELLPVRIDFKSLFPLAYAVTPLLVNPEAATALSVGSIASYSLSPGAERRIAAPCTASAGF